MLAVGLAGWAAVAHGGSASASYADSLERRLKTALRTTALHASESELTGWSRGRRIFARHGGVLAMLAGRVGLSVSTPARCLWG